MNVYISFICSFYSSALVFIDVLLDKKTELLDLMIKHGIIDGLSEIYSTCSDEDALV